MIKTITWNTGRLYTAEGQVMTARFDFDSRRVIFRDHSRGITGALRAKLPPTHSSESYASFLAEFVDREYLHNRYDYDQTGEADQLQRVKGEG